MERTVATKVARRSSGRADASEAQILLTAIDGLPEFLHRRGVDPRHLLRARGQKEGHAMRLDLPRYCALIELAAEHTGNDSFGLQLGREAAPGRLGLLGDAALAAPTLTGALDVLVRLFPFYQQNTAAHFRQEDGVCRFEYRILDGRILERRQDAELTMATILGLIRACLGSAWAPDEVHFEHPQPAGVQMHRRVFNAPVCFSMETNALVFRDPGLTRAMPGADAIRLRSLCDELMRLACGTGTLCLTDQVLGEIRSRLAAGYPHIEDIADALRLTRWTMQRRLAEQGQVFSDLVEATRCRLAEMHLGAAHMPIQEIADVLGYSELSAFTRACVRWFGKPPSLVRARILRDRSDAADLPSAEMSIASAKTALISTAQFGLGEV
ncbi:AraC family transcriptional regulator ligand-binding domain-containing protein [Acidisoma cellulosilytica]|uniref:AraC family transcriptional regulator ligand-binding domain-containing protein n=1 Tax=Acidisoma cellulosilyticum TaxID=2802395 RepID=A0A963Z4H2_9PROT|nr:AraC family transcriptional regulator [Acidisoma cellulosilyticum]MCB8882715.1 AraC family transcriptional regulator ligand-binding domain-containing protein [Acidisoma cellulosilyticum]